MLSRNEALWPRTDRRKKGKIKYPAAEGSSLIHIKWWAMFLVCLGLLVPLEVTRYTAPRGVGGWVGGVTEWFDEDKNDGVRALTLGP